MSIPQWLRDQEISASFRVNQDDWQPVTILLTENSGKYFTPDGEEEGSFQYIAHGEHPLGGDVMILHWLEDKGPLEGNTGIDTLWFQQENGAIKVRGTFFLDRSHDYGEIV